MTENLLKIMFNKIHKVMSEFFLCPRFTAHFNNVNTFYINNVSVISYLKIL